MSHKKLRIALGLRAYRPGREWKSGPLALAFWSTNIGLALMVVEFLHSGHMNQLRWMRMFGDTVFPVGVVTLGWFAR